MPENVPVVFISSTAEDLKPYRAAARDAAIAAGFHPEMMEYFEASGAHPPLEECLARVDKADVLVVLVAHRYGWVPPGQTKSITWLECEHAKNKKEVLAFLVDPGFDWPIEQKEEYKLLAAVGQGKAVEVAADVQARVYRLREFKAWLDGIGTRNTFTTPEDLRGKVYQALTKWRERYPEFAAPPPEPAGLRYYLRWLREETAWIDIRGLQVGTGKAQRFPIQDLYMELTTAGEADRAEGGLRAPVALQEALKHPRLVIVGDPGAGKSTFLRRIAFDLARVALGEPVEKPLLAAPTPLFIRVADLNQHIRRHLAARTPSAPTNPSAPAWLAHFLGEQGREFAWGTSEEFFRRLLSDGSLVLLDGLDEAPDRTEREQLAKLFENATRAYGACRFAVTTRPQAYSGEAVLAGFEHRHIAPLEPEAIETFLKRWSEALFPQDADRAAKHAAELAKAVQGRVEIRRLARNPVMLTALAVVHWHEKRLPEQRADLYESILLWLARSRENRPGRAPAEQCLRLLQSLALAMQNHPAGRQVQAPKRWAAEQVAPQFRDLDETLRIPAAERFLDEEEVDSGIVVSRGKEIRFWHLTFQEYLAAKALAGLEDKQLPRLLLPNKIYRPEWRETTPLLAGILHGHGIPKVDALLKALLDALGDSPALATQARCVGLLGAILRDLAPYKYQLTDPRYQAALAAVLGIFDAKESAGIDFKVRLEAAEALGQAGDPRLAEDNWVTIPAGRFLMGAQKTHRTKPNYDAKADDDEGPVREVYLEAFQIGRYPVTVEEYRRFIEEGGYQEQRWWGAGGFGARTQPGQWEDQLLHPNRPVVNVSWYEAAAYCAWAGCRLLTEAEWERAARGTEGRTYPWGKEKPNQNRANYDGEVGHPTPVGLYPLGATPEGVLDMAGNVWEWTADWYGQTRCLRVVRGGSWYENPGGLRAAFRYWNVPDLGFNDLGFRCGREVP